jgi:hypothetical protein
MTTKNAFRAFFRAFNEGLEEEALEAAGLSLYLPLTFEALDEELYNASGPALKALWGHRRAVLGAIAEGFSGFIFEVGDLQGWTLSSPHDTSCCAKVGPLSRRHFGVFVARVLVDISLMNISNFIKIMSSQEVFRCPSCKAPLLLDFRRLYRCLERHFDDSIERVSPAFLDL